MGFLANTMQIGVRICQGIRIVKRSVYAHTHNTSTHPTHLPHGPHPPQTTKNREKKLKFFAPSASFAPLWMINVKLIKTCLSPSETVYSSSSRDIPKSDILTVFFSPTRQFLAAKSRWMQFFDSKYCIPAAASKHMPKEEINR